MRKNYLLEPDVQVKTFEVKNLVDVTDYAEGFIVGEKLTASNLHLAESYPIQLEIADMYSVDDNIYIRTYDRYLYQLRGSQIFQKIKCGYKPAVMGAVILQGEKKTLYLDETGGQVLEDSQVTVDLPYGKYFATYALRCFVAKDYTIYFSSPFDFTERSMALDNCGNISVDYQDGEIIGIYDYSSYLLIVCTKCFYKLTVIDGEFKLERIKYHDYEIWSRSLVKRKEKVLFIADKKLYAFEDFSVKEMPCVFVKDILTIDCPATTNSNYYYCQTQDPEKKCVFVYDFVKGQDSLVYVGNSILLCKNMLYNYEEQRFYVITLDSAESSTWRSVAMNLGTNDKKSLIEISIKVEKDATLTIKGDFGSRTFILKEGINKKTMNLRSCEFVFTIDCPTSDMVVSDLKLKYIA